MLQQTPRKLVCMPCAQSRASMNHSVGHYKTHKFITSFIPLMPKHFLSFLVFRHFWIIFSSLSKTHFTAMIRRYKNYWFLHSNFLAFSNVPDVSTFLLDNYKYFIILLLLMFDLQSACNSPKQSVPFRFSDYNFIMITHSTHMPAYTTSFFI